MKSFATSTNPEKRSRYPARLHLVPVWLRKSWACHWQSFIYSPACSERSTTRQCFQESDGCRTGCRFHCDVPSIAFSTFSSTGCWRRESIRCVPTLGLHRFIVFFIGGGIHPY